jgi:hypothetical protein
MDDPYRTPPPPEAVRRACTEAGPRCVSSGAPFGPDLLREQLNQQKKVLRWMRVLMGVGLLPWVGVGLLLWHARPEAPPPVIVTYCPQAEETTPQDDVIPVVDAREVTNGGENDPVRAVANARASLLRVLSDKSMTVQHVSIAGAEFRRAMGESDLRTKIIPVELDGGKMGLKLLRLPSGGYWDLMGMRKGDVLVALNGYGLRDPRTALQAHAEMMRARHGVFELERDGERRAVSVRWDD